jgi:hypothetical protein
MHLLQCGNQTLRHDANNSKINTTERYPHHIWIWTIVTRHMPIIVSRAIHPADAPAADLLAIREVAELLLLLES